jgi:DNA-binding beta-propeller fold protein YncE
VAVAGCGSAPDSELPPPAGPASSPPLTARPAGKLLPAEGEADAVATRAALEGGRVAVLSARKRRLELLDARTRRRLAAAPAGTGPTQVVSDGGHYAYVTDTKAGSLLVFRTAPELQLTRRYALPGSPYGIAYDRRAKRLWVTLTATNELVELAAGARPHRLRRFPTVRQPNGVAVDPRGRVLVKSDGVLQVIDPSG